MKNENFKYFVTMVAALLATFATSVAGAFAISCESREKTEISSRIRNSEREISKIRRETEDLNVRIAQQENPSILGRRASGKLSQPSVSGVVWVYEDPSNNSVIFSERKNGSVSLKISGKTRIK